jgi:hypothetical protein
MRPPKESALSAAAHRTDMTVVQRRMNAPFAFENDLCAALEHRLEGLLGCSSLGSYSQTLRQRSVGQVIPDFLYMRADQALQPDRIRGLSALEASVVATLLPGKPLRPATIARQLYSRAERVAQRLRMLEKRGVLESVKGGAFGVRSELNWWSVHVVAVEAKLRRWREAMQQAVSYLTFANQSYVALPSTVVDGNKELAAAAEGARVGIIAVTESGAMVAREAPIGATWSADWVWLLSRTVGLPTRSGPSETSTSLRRISGTRAANRVDDSSLSVG